MPAKTSAPVRRRVVTKATTQSFTLLDIALMPKPTRAKPRHLEAKEQRLFVARWRLDPRTRELPACAIPNGGKRGVREAALLKAEGVSAGAPDWLCFASRAYRTGGHIGLALEFKSPDGSGRLSDDQRLWRGKLEAEGWRYEIVTSADEAWRVACDYLGLMP